MVFFLKGCIQFLKIVLVAEKQKLNISSFILLNNDSEIQKLAKILFNCLLGTEMSKIQHHSKSNNSGKNNNNSKNNNFNK